MSPQSETAHLYQLLDTYRKRLTLRIQQFAIQGPAHVTSEVYLGIEDARANIKQIKERLYEAGADVDDRPDDEGDITLHFPELKAPKQIPPLHRFYVERPDEESELTEALRASDGPPITNLFGISGVGKSLLAIHTIHSMCEKGHFHDGVLWGDLNDLTPDSLFLSFLGALEQRLYQRAPSQLRIKRDLFWRLIANKRMLIVVDNVKDERQLGELFPATDIVLNNCRVLAISIKRLTYAPFDMCFRRLDSFSKEQAIRLFCKYTGEEYINTYGDDLTEIGKRLGYFPHLIATAARELASRKEHPQRYAARLISDEHPDALSDGTIFKGLELAIGDLSGTQRSIFEHIAVLGEGSWSCEMLAAVALQPLAEVQATVDLIVERELIVPDGNTRYRVNTFIREFAWKLFRKGPDYHQQAAYILLARFCLDLAQAHDAMLVAQAEWRETASQPAIRGGRGFVQAFRELLGHEMPHIQRVLAWANQHCASDILLRFAGVAAVELLSNFVANGYEIRAAFCLGTLLEPIVWAAGDHHALRFQSLISAKQWEYKVPEMFGDELITEAGLSEFQIAHAKKVGQAPRCEFNLEINVGQIIDGMFAEMCLIDTKWSGVRASNLILREVELLGGRFLACDLSQSIWSDGDARGISLIRCNLRGALLKRIKLYGAHLHDVDLTGAILEQVDLRGADLRGVNLTGAVLEEVDLRGAALTDVNFTGAQLRDIRMEGVKIERVRWTGIRKENKGKNKTTGHSTIIVDNLSLLKEIGLGEQEPAAVDMQWIRPRVRLERKDFEARPDEQKRHSRVRLSQADLKAKGDARALNLTQISGAEGDLREIDLSAAVLTEAIFWSAKLHSANLRGAILSKANLNSATLTGADLRAALLKGAILNSANLRGVIARGAYLADADLRGATLTDADLRGADLSRAKLNGARLDGAVLAGANLCGADLTDADLRGVNLHGANLTGGTLTGADFTSANCLGAILLDTGVTEVQLVQADQLGRARLAADQVVQIFDGKYTADATLAQRFLCYGSFPGQFISINLDGQDLHGARMSGIFASSSLAGANLTSARLDGLFALVDASAANLAGARLSGSFADVSFHKANFTGADLRGANLVCCNLASARALSLEQLKQAQRLRGTRLNVRTARALDARWHSRSMRSRSMCLPDHAHAPRRLPDCWRPDYRRPDRRRYAGQLKLEGDREDARRAGYDPDNPDAMALFYQHNMIDMSRTT